MSEILVLGIYNDFWDYWDLNGLLQEVYTISESDLPLGVQTDSRTYRAACRS